MPPPPPQRDRQDQLPAAAHLQLTDAQRVGTHLLPRFVKAEANLLRLPLFALHTKGLRTLDGIECRGTTTRNGETHQFTLIASRSTRTTYPGPLARAAHLAFLSIATERGLPLTNPISWGWRDLCRRMGITYSGREVLQLKAAIKSTSFLSIESQYAVYSKPDSRMIHTRDEGMRLYERYAFIGSEHPDGGTADANYLWLADWYLDNLNAMFTAPLDYELWRWLDRQSSIASRLYEFLLINFYSGTPVLRINYEKLAQFLPVRPERYRSKAKEQFEPAFNLLTIAGVINSVEWAQSKNSIAQIHIRRGNSLTAPRDQAQLPFQFMEEEFEGSFEVKEIRNQKPLEWIIVADFYRLWEGNDKPRPTKRELEQARELIEQYGQKKAKAIVPRAVKLMKAKFPDAKTFGAITKYVGDASKEYDREERRMQREREEEAKRQKEREEVIRQKAEQVKLIAAWKPVWDGLTEEEREEIRRAAIGEKPYLRNHPQLAERLCLTELAQRRGLAAGQTPTV